MRRHVMMNLLDAEQSYVESLRTLIQVWKTYFHIAVQINDWSYIKLIIMTDFSSEDISNWSFYHVISLQMCKCFKNINHKNQKTQYRLFVFDENTHKWFAHQEKRMTEAWCYCKRESGSLFSSLSWLITACAHGCHGNKVSGWPALLQNQNITESFLVNENTCHFIYSENTNNYHPLIDFLVLQFTFLFV